jgi:Kef-type K+ transport system membrane component KefB/voltage-gated potassium channel Kch
VDHSLASEIASCIIAAWALAVLAQMLRQPLILAYLAAGFACGPRGLQLVKSEDHISVIAEIGLSLLLFMIGLEIDLRKMLRAGRVITLASLTQIVGGCVLGLGFFWVCGFALGGGRLDALYLAVATALSSTVIIVKILYDKRELDTLPGRLTLGVLVLQDLFAILFLAFRPKLQDGSLLVLVPSLGKVLLLVAFAFVASKYFLPRLFKAMARAPELVLVGALAWCFILAGAAHWLGLSREMGALIAGVALSTFPYTLDVAAKVTSLRDFFVTLFFVGLGMRIPAPTLDLLLWALAVGVFVVVSRFATVFPILHRLNQGHRVSLLPAINLSQISEFSLVILVLGVQSQHIQQYTLDVVAYAFVLLAAASSYGIAASDTLARKMGTLLRRFGLRDLDQGDAGKSGEAEEEGEDGHGAKPRRIMMLGFFTTASSLVAEIERSQPDLLAELAVLDFNPLVNQKLRPRGIRVIYGDISKRETLVHAGVGRAEILVCTLPNSILKGTTNLILVRQLREINPTAQIIATSESFEEIDQLYKAGANYVRAPRMTEAAELCTILTSALHNRLPAQRAEMEARLVDRNEVLP